MEVFVGDEGTLKRCDEGGFTLPELLVTILVMGIIFAIATTSWLKVTEGRKVDAAANQVLGDLRLAHTSASNQLTDWRVVFGDASSPTPWKVSCNGQTADYCLVKLSASYDQDTPPLLASSGPSVSQSIPRFLPEGTSVLGRNNFPSDNALVLTGYISGPKGTVEFNTDGSANVIASPLPPRSTLPEIRIGTSSKERKISVGLATSKVKNAT